MAEASKKYSGAGLPIKIADEAFGHYESKEFTVANAQTDYDMKTQVTDAFSTVKRAHGIIIRTDQSISVKLNATGSDSITLTSTEAQLVVGQEMRMEITNIFITNASGSTANVKILLFP